MNQTEEKVVKTDAPGLLTVSPSPHIRRNITTRSIMLDVLIALTPACLWGIYVYGIRAALILLISVASSVFFEWAYRKILKLPSTVGDLSAAVTGLLLGMNLPATVPYWIPVVGSLFAIVLVKQIFGGIGKNFLNPALAARVFLFLSWPAFLSGSAYMFGRPDLGWNATVDAVASATPLVALKEGALGGASLLDMFLGNIGGCIGEVSALCLIIGGVYLLIRKVITWHIPVSFLGTVAILCLIFPQTANRFEFAAYELLAGGLILGAIFMATDYVTSPITAKGRIIFGVGCGLIVVLIRFFGGYPEGVSFAILVMNALVWYIDKVTKPRVFGGKKHGKK